MADLEQFRAETRAWLEENCPPSMRTPMVEEEVVWGGRNQKFVNPESKIWLDRMVGTGWSAPAWPKEYGGGGLSKAEAIIRDQEMKRLNARPPPASFGIWRLGPVLLEYATEEQKKRFLPDIVAGETRWCQGSSEPGAGPDLAGPPTKCADKGDHSLINGSKIWTSYPYPADWILWLVLTAF